MAPLARALPLLCALSVALLRDDPHGGAVDAAWAGYFGGTLSVRALEAAGIDKVYVFCVNDAAVMQAWKKDQGLAGSELIEFVADKAAARCLDHANEHQDPETGYIATSANDGTHQWCAVWANHVKNPRKKTIEFPNEIGAFAAELPKQVLSQAVAMRARLTHVDTYSELCTNELMAVKGAGILRVDLLSLPPLASSGRGWTVRPVTPLTERIDRVPYPIPRPDDDDAAAPTPAIRISHDLPKDLALVDPSPRVGWWDETKSEWTEAGVSDVVLDADTNRLSFSTIVLERFAVVQSRCAMFPYRAWHVRPTAGNVGDSVTVSVTPASFHVTEGSPLEIEVGDGWARLANAEDLPVPRFSALRGMSNEAHTLTHRRICTSQRIQRVSS